MSIAVLGVNPPPLPTFFVAPLAAGLPCLQIVHETLRGKCSTRPWPIFRVPDGIKGLGF